MRPHRLPPASTAANDEESGGPALLSIIIFCANLANNLKKHGAKAKAKGNVGASFPSSLLLSLALFDHWAHTPSCGIVGATLPDATTATYVAVLSEIDFSFCGPRTPHRPGDGPRFTPPRIEQQQQQLLLLLLLLAPARGTPKPRAQNAHCVIREKAFSRKRKRPQGPWWITRRCMSWPGQSAQGCAFRRGPFLVGMETLFQSSLARNKMLTILESL